MRANQGLTLIELMVAVGIMAMISVGSFRVYKNVQNAQTRIEERSDKLVVIQRAFAILGQDLNYLVNRAPAANDQDSFGFGNAIETSSLAFQGQARQIDFTRNSSFPTLTPPQTPHSELRRVQWRYENGELSRNVWEHVDAGPEAQPVVMLLMEDIEDLQFRYFGAQSDYDQSQNQVTATNQPEQRQWFEDWPKSDELNQDSVFQNPDPNNSETPQSQTNPVTMPLLVEVQLNSKVFGELRRVFPLSVDQLQLDQSQTTANQPDDAQDSPQDGSQDNPDGGVDAGEAEDDL